MPSVAGSHRQPRIKAEAASALGSTTPCNSKAEHDRRMQALDSFLSSYEAEHGAITDAEIDQAVHRARSRATVVRSAAAKRAKGRRGAA